MNRKIFRFASSVLWFLSLAAGTIAESALACNVPPAPMNPPPPVTVRHKTRTTVKIRIKNYTTFGVGVGQRCACGLSTAGLGTIVSVDRARIVRAGTNTLVPGFSFTPNQTTTDSFNALQAGSWFAFLSGIDTPVPEGIQTEIVFDATVVDGSTDDDVAADLVPGTIGTAPANMDATVDTTDPNHLSLVAPGNITSESFAYTANSGSGDATFYLVDNTNGPLSPRGNITLQGNPVGLVYIPRELPQSLIDAVAFANRAQMVVEVYDMDRDTGALTLNGTVPSGGLGPTDLAATPSNPSTGQSSVYVANQISNNLGVFRFDQSSGTLTQIQSVPTGPSPQKVTTFTTAAAQRFVVSANCGGPTCDGLGSVSVYGANPMTGMLTEVPGSPFLTGRGTVFVGVNPAGTVGFTSNLRSNDISVFAIDQTTGAWNLVATFPIRGMGPSSVAVDLSGQFLIAVSQFSSDGAIAIINPDLTLTEIGTFSTGMGPFSVTFDATGRFFYVPNLTSGNVSGFNFDNTTGTATPLPGSPYPAGAGAIKIKIVNPLAPID